jgi:hypothetical protein
VPHILAKIYAGLTPSPADWCIMAVPSHDIKDAASGDDAVAYFNKRTSEVRRERPPEMDAPALSLAPPASPSAAAAAAAATANKEAVLENTQTFDGLLTWLDWGKKVEAEGACGPFRWLIDFPKKLSWSTKTHIYTNAYPTNTHFRVQEGRLRQERHALARAGGFLPQRPPPRTGAPGGAALLPPGRLQRGRRRGACRVCVCRGAGVDFGP